eukprot:m.99935 g.99935  ORF g.99935 m.99935 type:complete len:460 (+) comp15106_c0_seq1:22-1401(+)
MRLNIRTLDNSTFSISVDASGTVDDLKSAIHAAEPSWSAERQRLLYRGRVLEAGHTISEYDIQEDVTLHLIDKSPGQADQPSTARHSAQQPPRGEVRATLSGQGPAASGAFMRALQAATQQGAAVFAQHVQQQQQAQAGGSPMSTHERHRQMHEQVVRQHQQAHAQAVAQAREAQLPQQDGEESENEQNRTQAHTHSFSVSNGDQPDINVNFHVMTMDGDGNVQQEFGELPSVDLSQVFGGQPPHPATAPASHTGLGPASNHATASPASSHATASPATPVDPSEVLAALEQLRSKLELSKTKVAQAIASYEDAQQKVQETRSRRQEIQIQLAQVQHSAQQALVGSQLPTLLQQEAGALNAQQEALNIRHELEAEAIVLQQQAVEHELLLANTHGGRPVNASVTRQQAEELLLTRLAAAASHVGAEAPEARVRRNLQAFQVDTAFMALCGSSDIRRSTDR